MNRHIHFGHQYSEIKQLLLYSLGLQGQKIVVGYEMAGLARFSALVNESRSTDVRCYAGRDRPGLQPSITHLRKH